MLFNLTYTQAIAKAEHLKALGQTTVHLDRDASDLPWDKVIRVEAGCGVRLSGPTCFNVIALDNGLTLKWSVDLERRNADGQCINLFDRDRLREVARKLPDSARKALAEFLSKEVLPEVSKRTEEWRGYLERQRESEETVRSLIAYAKAA